MMKSRLFSNSITSTKASVGLLLLRLMTGLGMAVGHGWGKLSQFSENLGGFADPLGIGSPASFIGAVFSEFVCALLIAAGLCTRLAAVPLIFTMGVAAFVVHADDPFSTQEKALLYFFAYLALLFTGPGKFSMDQKLR